MKIEAGAEHGVGAEDWAVLAEWLGAERVVFKGDVFACCRFVAENS